MKTNEKHVKTTQERRVSHLDGRHNGHKAHTAGGDELPDDGAGAIRVDDPGHLLAVQLPRLLRPHDHEPHDATLAFSLQITANGHLNRALKQLEKASSDARKMA